MKDKLIKIEDDDGHVWMVERWIGGEEPAIKLKRLVNRPTLEIELADNLCEWGREAVQLFSDALSCWAKTSRLSPDDDERYIPNTWKREEPKGFVDLTGWTPPTKEQEAAHKKKFDAGIAKYEESIKEEPKP